MTEAVRLEPQAQRPGDRRTVALGLFIAVVLVLAALAAVVKRPPSSSKAQLVLAASANTQAARSASVTISVGLSIDGKSQLSLDIHGALDFDRRVGVLTMNGPGFTAEVRQLDSVAYFHADQLDLPDGKSWVKVTPGDIGVSADASEPSVDPLADLELVGGLKGEPKLVGPEQVDGVPVTHYGITVDLTKALDKVTHTSGTVGNDPIVHGLESLKGMVDISNIPGDVWLDSAGRAREFKLTVHLQSAGRSVDEVLDEHLGDFGTAVSTDAPPDDQVIPFSDVPNVFKTLTPK